MGHENKSTLRFTSEFSILTQCLIPLTYHVVMLTYHECLISLCVNVQRSSLQMRAAGMRCLSLHECVLSVVLSSREVLYSHHDSDHSLHVPHHLHHEHSFLWRRGQAGAPLGQGAHLRLHVQNIICLRGGGELHHGAEREGPTVPGGVGE